MHCNETPPWEIIIISSEEYYNDRDEYRHTVCLYNIIIRTLANYRRAGESNFIVLKLVLCKWFSHIVHRTTASRGFLRNGACASIMPRSHNNIIYNKLRYYNTIDVTVCSCDIIIISSQVVQDTEDRTTLFKVLCLEILSRPSS